MIKRIKEITLYVAYEKQGRGHTGETKVVVIQEESSVILWTRSVKSVKCAE
jgi:hypothetical protein